MTTVSRYLVPLLIVVGCADQDPVTEESDRPAVSPPMFHNAGDDYPSIEESDLLAERSAASERVPPAALAFEGVKRGPSAVTVAASHDALQDVVLGDGTLPEGTTVVRGSIKLDQDSSEYRVHVADTLCDRPAITSLITLKPGPSALNEFDDGLIALVRDGDNWALRRGARDAVPLKDSSVSLGETRRALSDVTKDVCR